MRLLSGGEFLFEFRYKPLCAWIFNASHVVIFLHQIVMIIIIIIGIVQSIWHRLRCNDQLKLAAASHEVCKWFTDSFSWFPVFRICVLHINSHKCSFDCGDNLMSHQKFQNKSVFKAIFCHSIICCSFIPLWNCKVLNGNFSMRQQQYKKIIECESFVLAILLLPVYQMSYKLILSKHTMRNLSYPILTYFLSFFLFLLVC